MKYLLFGIAFVLCMAAAVFVGIFIGVRRMQKAIETQSVGYLRIDRSEPEEPPRPFLELRRSSINDISKKNVILLKVINENYISRD